MLISTLISENISNPYGSAEPIATITDQEAVADTASGLGLAPSQVRGPALPGLSRGASDKAYKA